MTTLVIMQPYFVPYAGYFTLMRGADIFILYDCVQFPRRGWVHRNRLTSTAGDFKWLTLPLEKMPQAAKIHELKFASDAIQSLKKQFNTFPVLQKDVSLQKELLNLSTTFVDYTEKWLHHIATILGFDFNPLRSSQLDIPTDLKGQERILYICQKFSATRYLNAAGGSILYEQPIFHAHGIELSFLKPWEGNPVSMLERIIQEKPEDICNELDRHLAYSLKTS